MSPAACSTRWMRALVGAPDQGPLDSAVLIAQRDLQMKDLLAMALEAEVPRLDHARVNRTNRDLVDLFAFDPEKVRDADNRSFARRPVPRVMAGAIRAMKANRLEPGMPFGADAVLLGKLALEQMHLRAVGRQRVKVVRVEGRRDDTQDGARACRRGRRNDPHVAGWVGDVAEEGGDSLPALSPRRRRSGESPRTARWGPAPAESPGPFATTRGCCMAIIA